MIKTYKDLLRQAMVALQWYVDEDDVIEDMPGNEPWVEGKMDAQAAIAALQEAIDAPDPETSAWMIMNGVCSYQLMGSKKQADALCAELQKRHDLSGSFSAFHVVPLYLHPQQ